MKKIKIIVLLIPLFLTSGCLNYTELNDIGITDSIGIDKINNTYKININTLTPTANNLEKNETYEVESKNLNEAFDKLYLSTSKNINLSHLELLILSKNLKKEDYDNIKKFFLNRIESRNTFNVIILENYNSENIFKFNTDEINDLIVTNSKEDGLISPKTFDEMIQDILNINISYIPTIKIDNNISILGYRSIYKENKLLSYEENLSYNFLMNKINKCNLIDKNLNIKIDKSITNYSVRNNKITIKINSTLTDYNNDKYSTVLYEKTLKSYIKKYLDNNNLQYFFKLIEKYNYNYYKNSKNKNIYFDINIKSKINKEGIKNNE